MNTTGLTEGGLSAYPAGLVSSPPARYGTPRQSSVIIDVESPSPKWHTSSERDITTVREKMVPADPLTLTVFFQSPKPPSRAQSKATNKGEVDQRPWSPFSGRSKVTRATEKGTVYPPLPESRMGDVDSNLERVESPALKSRARSIAHSTPPGSPSQRVQLFASKPQYTNGGST